MTDQNNSGDKTLHVDVKKTLTLKPKTGDTSVVRQSFSHGRTKAVVVETKKPRRILKPGEVETPVAAQPAPAAPRPAAPAAPSAAPMAAPAVAKAPIATPAAPVAAPAAPAAIIPAPAAPAAPSAAPVAAPVVAKAPVGAPVAAPRPAPATPPVAARPQAAPPASQPTRAPMAPQPSRTPPAPPVARTGVVLQVLSEGERAARERALAEARVREAEDRKRMEEEAKRRAEEDARLKREREEAERRKVEEEARKKAEDEARRKTEEAAARRLEGGASDGPLATAPRTPGGNLAPSARAPGAPAPAGGDRAGAAAKPGMPTPSTGAGRGALMDDDDEDSRRRAAARLGPGAARRPAVPAPKPTREKATIDKARGKLTVVTAQTDDEEEGGRGRSIAAMRRRVQRHQRKMFGTETREKISREVTIPETITIQELANRMAERAVDVIKLLMKQGQMMKINDIIDADTAQIIAEDMGHTVKRVAASDVVEGLFAAADVGDDLTKRPPVVTIMGHVDHGKTSLLDAIRHANVVAGEAGGITQHIGAYQVEHHGEKITFIDTPGHEAFTSMRARGAKATDIVILVVAADDGVMPTTIEAINHTRAAGVPLIVAINKIDKGDANPQRVRTELLQHDIVVESMGGETLEVEVSATKKINLDKLLEAIILQTEVLELKANPDRSAEGTVIEAKLDKGRGNVATVLVQRGTLKPGDILVAGAAWGRVRALLNDKGGQVKEAGPSMPVEVLGFQDTPEAGDRFAVVENEARAREVADYRVQVKRDKAAARGGARTSLADMMTQLKDAGRKDFVLIIKGDVQGSVEAIVGALEKLGNDEVRARVVHAAVGGITESDVTLAATTGAVIIGFNVRASREARDASEREGIEVRYYNIIYDLVDEVKSAMSGMLAPIRKEIFLGNAEILEIFAVSKVGKVAGCRVTEGIVERGAGVRLIRQNVVMHEGKLSTLKRFKDDVNKVEVGQECGMSFESYQDMRAGDVIECYRVEQVARTL
jgi:translation initiation factor IF-2